LHIYTSIFLSRGAYTTSADEAKLNFISVGKGGIKYAFTTIAIIKVQDKELFAQFALLSFYAKYIICAN
jgi:hypothetical protein